jgi:hypothetical protein
MMIDMNEAQVRTVEQVRQVLQATQALVFCAAPHRGGPAFEGGEPSVEVGQVQ